MVDSQGNSSSVHEDSKQRHRANDHAVVDDRIFSDIRSQATSFHQQSTSKGVRAVYIGGGAVVLIIVIVLIVFLVRR